MEPKKGGSMRSNRSSSSASVRRTLRGARGLLLLIAAGVLLSGPVRAWAASPAQAEPRLYFLAQADDSDAADEEARGGKLEPRYQPREPEPKSWYNGSYVFGITRTIAGSTMVPAAKVPLFVLSVPLDIAFLPFALIGGLFG